MNLTYAMSVAREVARLGSLAKAARSLRLSPPSVSRLVGELEEELGVRLFNRTTRRLALTDEGELFDLLNKHQVFHIDELTNQQTGCIYLYSDTHIDISATEIRQAIKQNQPSVNKLLPNAVVKYIHKYKIY